MVKQYTLTEALLCFSIIVHLPLFKVHLEQSILKI